MYDEHFMCELTHLQAIGMLPEQECKQLPDYVHAGHIGAMGASMAGLSISDPPAVIEPSDQWHRVLSSAMLLVKIHCYTSAVMASHDFEMAISMCTTEHITARFHVLISEWGNVYYASKDE